MGDLVNRKKEKFSEHEGTCSLGIEEGDILNNSVIHFPQIAIRGV